MLDVNDSLKPQNGLKWCNLWCKQILAKRWEGDFSLYTTNILKNEVNDFRELRKFSEAKKKKKPTKKYKKAGIFALLDV